MALYDYKIVRQPQDARARVGETVTFSFTVLYENAQGEYTPVSGVYSWAQRVNGGAWEAGSGSYDVASTDKVVEVKCEFWPDDLRYESVDSRIATITVLQPLSINRADGKWKVGIHNIYVPSTPCKIEHSNVTSPETGRDENGIMHIEWLRRDVRKVFLKYNAITETELQFLMSKMQGKEFTFTFPDQGTEQTMEAYVGKCSYEFYTYSDLYAEGVYTNFEIHVIEK